MNVLGKVKYEIIDKLFQAGYFPSPEDVEFELEIFRQKEALEEFNSKMRTFAEKNIFLQKFYERPEKSLEEERLMEMNLGAYLKHESESNSLHKYYYKAQDIKVVLETLCVAKNSQNNFILADSSKLRTLQRVVDNAESYLSLLNDVKNEIRLIEKTL